APTDCSCVRNRASHCWSACPNPLPPLHTPRPLPHRPHRTLRRRQAPTTIRLTAATSAACAEARPASELLFLQRHHTGAAIDDRTAIGHRLRQVMVGKETRRRHFRLQKLSVAILSLQLLVCP